MDKKWYRVTFNAEMSKDDVRAMKKCFYEAMEDSMQIGPCSDLDMTIDDKSDGMTIERKAELFDKAVEWIWEHTNYDGASEFLRALRHIGYSEKEIFAEIVRNNFDDDHEAHLCLEIEDLLECDIEMGKIKVDKNIFDAFTPNAYINIQFNDTKSEEILSYVMTSEDDEGIYMEYLGD